MLILMLSLSNFSIFLQFVLVFVVSKYVYLVYINFI